MSNVKFWLREGDERFLKTTRKFSSPLVVQPGDYVQGLLTGMTEDKNELFARASREDYVFGAVHPWDVVRDNRCLYVELERSPLSSGLIITSNSRAHVRFELGKETIDTKTGLERFEFLPGSSFIDKTFKTFDYAFSTRAKTGYTPRLLLYDSSGQIGDDGNIANPTPAGEVRQAVIMKEILKRRVPRITDTSTFKGWK